MYIILHEYFVFSFVENRDENELHPYIMSEGNPDVILDKSLFTEIRWEM